MKLDLTEILGRVGMHYVYEIEQPPIVDEDLACSTPVVGNITLTNAGSALVVSGAVDTVIEQCCSRCLVYFQEPVHVVVDEQFVLGSMKQGPRGRHVPVVVEDDENPDAARLFEGPMLDLTEMLRQGIALMVPIQPLHSPDCKGLCQLCGKDLNQGACGCEPALPNPAMGPLAALLKEMEER